MYLPYMNPMDNSTVIGMMEMVRIAQMEIVRIAQMEIVRIAKKGNSPTISLTVELFPIFSSNCINRKWFDC